MTPVVAPSLLPGIGERLLDARAAEVEALAGRMSDDRAVVIVGDHAVGKTRLVSRAAALLAEHGVRVVGIDLRECSSETRLAWLWMRALAGAVAGSRASIGTGSRKADVAVRRLLGPHTDWALAGRPAALSPGETAAALEAAQAATRGAADETTTLVVFDHAEAPLAAPRAPVDLGALLWSLRSAAQGSDRVHVTLVAHPAVVDELAGPGSAYLGAPSVVVSRPSADAWRRALDGDDRRLSVVDDVLSRTRGHVPAAIGLLEALRDGRSSVGAAFDALVRTQTQHADRCLRHAAGLHRLGAQALQAIARGERPYQAIPEARSSRDIANALTALWRAGLLTRPEPRRWEVTDPFVARLLGA